MNGGGERSSAHNTHNFPSAKLPQLQTSEGLHLALEGAVTVPETTSCFSREVMDYPR